MDSLQGGGDPDDPGAVGLDRPIWFPTTIPKPIIAAINGACAGIGLCAALMCDLRFAAAGAKFTTAFVRRGLVAEHGSSWVLPRLIGHARALDLLYSGRVFLAEEAKELGVVNQVFAPEELVDRTREYAKDLIRHCSPRSMATIKAEIYRHWNMELAPAVKEANELMVRSFGFPDFKEGVQSFVQRRNPDFASLQQHTWLTPPFVSMHCPSAVVEAQAGPVQRAVHVPAPQLSFSLAPHGFGPASVDVPVVVGSVRVSVPAGAPAGTQSEERV